MSEGGRRLGLGERGRMSEGGCRSAEWLRKQPNPKLRYIYEELLGLARSYWASAFLGGGHYSVAASKNGFMEAGLRK